MALRLAVVVSQAPGLGGTPSSWPPLDSGGKGLGGSILGDVEVTEPPGQGGDHPRPLRMVDAGNLILEIDHAVVLVMEWPGRA